jgi:hypothetical protein
VLRLLRLLDAGMAAPARLRALPAEVGAFGVGSMAWCFLERED